MKNAPDSNEPNRMPAEPARSAPSRRDFLRTLGLGAGSTWLAGCVLAPGERGWKWTTWAEPLNRALLEAGPFSHALVKEYPARAITADFPIRSLILPPGYEDSLGQWALTVDGLIEAPQRWSLAEFRQALPRTSHITRHDCVEGWSAIAEFAGVTLADLMRLVKPHPTARYVVCYSADQDERGIPYYGSLSLAQAAHPQTLLAYEMNGTPLTIDHGAPLRLRVPNQLGYKSTKYIHRVQFVDSFAGIGGGQGGYWEDQGYEHYAGI